MRITRHKYIRRHSSKLVAESPAVCIGRGTVYSISTRGDIRYRVELTADEIRCLALLLESSELEACEKLHEEAVPDMLEALKLALDDSSFEDGHAKLTMATLDKIRSAIAKAEGKE